SWANSPPPAPANPLAAPPPQPPPPLPAHTFALTVVVDACHWYVPATLKMSSPLEPKLPVSPSHVELFSTPIGAEPLKLLTVFHVGVPVVMAMFCPPCMPACTWVVDGSSSHGQYAIGANTPVRVL